MAEHVLGIGKGFTKIDMTAFTLFQIKTIVKRIEKKLDKILETPLNMAIDNFGSAMNLIINGEFKDAYDTLKSNVAQNARQAFYFKGGHNISLTDAEGMMSAARQRVITYKRFYNRRDIVKSNAESLASKPVSLTLFLRNLRTLLR